MATSTKKNNGRLFANAPSWKTEFPQQGEITAPEAVTYLPNMLRSHDMIFRFASNGITNKIVAAMINFYRAPPPNGPLKENTLCIVLQNVMRDCGIYQWQLNGMPVQWSLRNHRRFNPQGQQWNLHDLSLTGLHPDLNSPSELVDNVPFHHLAIGVRRFPAVSTGDGLNLTRCVLYARDHPNQGLVFPRDFVALTQRLGALPVQTRNEDGPTFDRWKNGTLPTAVEPSFPGAVQLLHPGPVQPAMPDPIQPALPAPVQPALSTLVQPSMPAAVQPFTPGPMESPKSSLVHPLNRAYIQPAMPGQPPVPGFMRRPMRDRLQHSMAVQAPPIAVRQAPALPAGQHMMRPGHTTHLQQVNDDDLRMAQARVDRWFGAAARPAPTARIIESQSRQDSDGDVEMSDEDLGQLFGRVL
jgi:hypothetical protein